MVRSWNDDGSELRVPVVPESNLVDATYTVAALVKPAAKTGFEAVMSARDAVNGRTAWMFGMNASNEPFFLVTQPNGSTQTLNPDTGGALTNGQWYIIVYTSRAESLNDFHVYDLEAGTWEHLATDLPGGIDEPQASAFIEFGRDIERGFDLNAEVALAAVWTSGMTNAQVEALATNRATGDWTLHALPPGGLWSFTQTAVTDDVPDVAGNHDAITGSISSDTDTIGRTTTTVVDDDPPDWDLTIPPPVFSFNLRLSGGAENEDGLLSIGGAMSSADASDVFNSSSSTQAVTGLTDYRCIYALNADAADGNLVAYVSGQLDADGASIAVGVATEPAGSTVTAIANRTTAPVGVSFSAPTTLETAVDCGDVQPGDMKGIWLRRVLPPGVAEDDTNPWAVTLKMTALES